MTITHTYPLYCTIPSFCQFKLIGTAKNKDDLYFFPPRESGDLLTSKLLAKLCDLLTIDKGVTYDFGEVFLIHPKYENIFSHTKEKISSQEIFVGKVYSIVHLGDEDTGEKRWNWRVET